MRDATLSPQERAVTYLARRKRPELQPQRPQGVEGLVWDALVLEQRPLQVKEIVHLTDLTRTQVCKAVGLGCVMAERNRCSRSAWRREGVF